MARRSSRLNPPSPPAPVRKRKTRSSGGPSPPPEMEQEESSRPPENAKKPKTDNEVETNQEIEEDAVVSKEVEKEKSEETEKSADEEKTNEAGKNTTRRKSKDENPQQPDPTDKSQEQQPQQPEEDPRDRDTKGRYKKDQKALRRSARRVYKTGDAPDNPQAWDTLVEYLANFQDDAHLDEDEIVARMHRTHKTGRQLAHNYKSLIGDNDYDYDYTLLQECIKQVQNQAITDDFVATLAEECKPALDRRTLAWIKRSLQTEDLLQMNALNRRSRLTRGMSRHNKKKKESGLDLLHQAVRGIEKERGSRFRPKKSDEESRSSRDDANKKLPSRRSVRRRGELIICVRCCIDFLY